MAYISVVIPVYGCYVCLNELYSRLKNTLGNISEDFEIILVNDASPDNSWEIIKKLCENDKRVKGINLSRNFGQHNAITAGLVHCSGEWVVVMDCDLQDQPEEILKLYEKAENGFDIVFAKRVIRNDKLIKRYISQLFYKLFNYLVDIKYDNSVANFGIYNNLSITEYLKHKEISKVFPISMRLIGFKTTAIQVLHGKRKNGKSSYNYSKLFHLALKIIVTQSNKPLYFSIFMGLIIALFALIYGIMLCVRYFLLNVPLGYTSIIVTILFIGGLLFVNLGLIGIYIGKIFDQVKERPQYIIKEKTFS